MPAPPQGSLGERSLPARLSLKHFKDEAKARLKAKRQNKPHAKLAEAQFQLAREYGFSSWRALKAHLDQCSSEGAPAATDGLWRYVGAYRYDPANMSNGLAELAGHDGRLYIQRPEGARFQLVEQENGVFSQPGLTRRFEFVGDRGRPSAAVIIRDERGSVRLERTAAHAVLQASSPSQPPWLSKRGHV